MSVQALEETSVTPTLCVPTLRDLMSAAVWKASRETVKPAQVMTIFYALAMLDLNIYNLFLAIQFRSWWNLLLRWFRFFLFSASAQLVCDPPCTGNSVCQNYSGDPECVCAEGFVGEGNCTGIQKIITTIITTVIFFIIIRQNWEDYIGLVVRPLYKSTNRDVHRYIGQFGIYLNNYLL